MAGNGALSSEEGGGILADPGGFGRNALNAARIAGVSRLKCLSGFRKTVFDRTLVRQ
jgi:hypothetical protein